MVAYNLSSRLAAGISPGQLRYHERFCVSLGATAAVVLGSLFSLVAQSSLCPSLLEEKVVDLLGLERYKVSKGLQGYRL